MLNPLIVEDLRILQYLYFPGTMDKTELHKSTTTQPQTKRDDSPDGREKPPLTEDHKNTGQSHSEWVFGLWSTGNDAIDKFGTLFRTTDQIA